MREEIEGLLEEQGLDILWVNGAPAECPDNCYLTGGAGLTSAWVIVRPGHDPVLCHNPMEREQAAATGMRTVSFTELGAETLSRELDDPLLVQAAMFAELARRENFSGSMTMRGVADPGDSIALLGELEKQVASVRFRRDNPRVTALARSTKSPDEIERMRSVAALTVEALGELLDFLSACRADSSGRVKDTAGEPVTTGRLGELLRLELALRGLDQPHGNIISLGREAGIPHASSPPETVLTTGRTLLLDVFPREGGCGYCFDITRTFCLGHAPDEVLELWEQVHEAQSRAIQAARGGVEGTTLQELALDYFEGLGHPTGRLEPGTEAGYVHSLGHGLGLELHEPPYLRLRENPQPADRLRPGSVFTIEPGLYYPDRGMGVRLEDVLYIDQQGAAELLSPFEKFPVLNLDN